MPLEQGILRIMEEAVGQEIVQIGDDPVSADGDGDGDQAGEEQCGPGGQQGGDPRRLLPAARGADLLIQPDEEQQKGRITDRSEVVGVGTPLIVDEESGAEDGGEEEPIRLLFRGGSQRVRLETGRIPCVIAAR